jgi:hypothetical protein
MCLYTCSSDLKVLYFIGIVDSSDPPKSSKYASVVHHTTNSLLVWASKTLESTSFDVGIPPDIKEIQNGRKQWLLNMIL